MEAEAKATEAKARFRIEQAKLDAEEELAVLSERGSSVTFGSRRSKVTSVTKLRKEIRAKGGSSCSIIGSIIKSSMNLPVNEDTLCDSRSFANEPVIRSKIEPISFRQKANAFFTKLEKPELVEATDLVNVKDYTNNLTHDNSYGRGGQPVAHAPYVAHWLLKSGALHFCDDKPLLLTNFFFICFPPIFFSGKQKTSET